MLVVVLWISYSGRARLGGVSDPWGISWSSWYWRSTTNLCEGTIQGCEFQVAWFLGQENIFWKLSVTVISLMEVEHDWWDNLYTPFQLFNPINLIGICLMDTRKLLLMPVLLPIRHSQCYFCWHISFLSYIMKAECSDYFGHICRLQTCVISPCISLCVLECELSAYLKFIYFLDLLLYVKCWKWKSAKILLFVCGNRHQKQST